MRAPRCGAPTRSGAPCRHPAGWNTDHLGAGRCALHEYEAAPAGQPPHPPAPALVWHPLDRATVFLVAARDQLQEAAYGAERKLALDLMRVAGGLEDAARWLKAQRREVRKLYAGRSSSDRAGAHIC